MTTRGERALHRVEPPRFPAEEDQVAAAAVKATTTIQQKSGGSNGRSSNLGASRGPVSAENATTIAGAPAPEQEGDRNDTPSSPLSGSSSSCCCGSGGGPLTGREVLNLAFSVLAWACTICNLTLVVGTSNVVALSIGAPAETSTVPLGAFFVGASLASSAVTPWCFGRWGRRNGLLVGVAFGLAASALGALSLVLALPPLFSFACSLFGASAGIGFHLRFAAIELVPPSRSARAVTLVVSGGCVAAFAGPQSAEGTKFAFGETENLAYMGVMVLGAAFNGMNGTFLFLVKFPPTAPTSPARTTSYSGTEAPQQQSSEPHRSELLSILRRRSFLVPMVLAVLSWAIMALPMSLLRVAMQQEGHSSSDSLLAIQFHFLGMYLPGFATGIFIGRFGVRVVAALAAVIFSVSLVLLQGVVPGISSSVEAGSVSQLAAWIAGMVAIGIGWNYGFSAATVWSTQTYVECVECKSLVQAANDALMFLIAGMLIFSASYVYEAGGSGISGWRALLWVVLGLLGVFLVVLTVDALLERRCHEKKRSAASPCQEDIAHEITAHGIGVPELEP